jgi:uncharacterized membrane protein YdjX (TVP38/TMEM64 family)
VRFRITGKAIGGALAVVAGFVGMSLLAHAYKHELGAFVGAGGPWGVAGFILLTAVFVVFLIPLDIPLLIPIAVTVWGPVATAVMSIAGWTLGSSIAFFSARHFGTPLVAQVAGKAELKQARKIAKRVIPKRHLFFWVIAAQALLPSDLTSYAFGLFADDIDLGPYALATAIGDLLPGFFFAFAGTLPAWYQIAALAAACVIAGVLFWRSREAD